jgi:hypothetical protein
MVLIRAPSEEWSPNRMAFALTGSRLARTAKPMPVVRWVCLVGLLLTELRAAILALREADAGDRTAWQKLLRQGRHHVGLVGNANIAALFLCAGGQFRQEVPHLLGNCVRDPPGELSCSVS